MNCESGWGRKTQWRKKGCKLMLIFPNYISHSWPLDAPWFLQSGPRAWRCVAWRGPWAPGGPTRWCVRPGGRAPRPSSRGSSTATWRRARRTRYVHLWTPLYWMRAVLQIIFTFPWFFHISYGYVFLYSLLILIDNFPFRLRWTGWCPAAPWSWWLRRPTREPSWPAGQRTRTCRAPRWKTFTSCRFYVSLENVHIDR